MLKIVDVEYVANLPLYLHIEFCGQVHRVQLEVMAASQLKTFMRKAKEDFDKNPPMSARDKPIFLGVISHDGTKPIPYNEWKRKYGEDG